MSGALGIETVGMTKRFGPVAALDDVSMKVTPGTVHALLGENGAGKSTLVKCIMGYYRADRGQIMIGGREHEIANPRDARSLGVGMVYQHFTLVPNMTVAENLVLSRPGVPAVIDWAAERKRLDEFFSRMPFRVDPGAQITALSAGERQKVEILKLLYLDQKILILDEPTSVLTPAEADEVLGLLRGMAQAGQVTIVMITHKFREVMKFCDEVTVLRRGKFAGAGRVADLTPADMAKMMIGAPELPATAGRAERREGATVLAVHGLTANDDAGLPAVENVDLVVRSGEIVGIAGVSGNGQRELVEILAGQREPAAGCVFVHGEPYGATRPEMRRHKAYCLPEEPLRNASVPDMSVAENLAFRRFDVPPMTALGWRLKPGAIRSAARDLIQRYRVKTHSPDAPIRSLSGGNIQRTVLARELSGDVDLLVAANPCFGLDFAAVAEIRSQIVGVRNRGGAVLLVSEDLDELLELSDRILVMFDGAFVYETPIATADIAAIGRHMAGH